MPFLHLLYGRTALLFCMVLLVAFMQDFHLPGGKALLLLMLAMSTSNPDDDDNTYPPKEALRDLVRLLKRREDGSITEYEMGILRKMEAQLGPLSSSNPPPWLRFEEDIPEEPPKELNNKNGA